MSDESNKKNETSTSDKTLSRSSLYAPLTAYASGSLRLPKKVATSHSEAAIIDWLQRLSADYHRTCQPGDPRNTGNRFLSTSELQEKIMHRTLNLFGNEYGAKLGRSSSNATQSLTSKSKRKTKHKRGKRISKNTVMLEESPEATKNFLGKLNRLWTQYMLKLLDTRGCGGDGKLMIQTAPRVIHECANNVEWVGAVVRIETCSAFSNWIGREGVLVSSTRNTWVLVETVSKNPDRFRKLVLPKGGSIVSVRLCLQPPTEQDHKRTDEDDDACTLRLRLRLDTIPE